MRTFTSTLPLVSGLSSLVLSSVLASSVGGCGENSTASDPPVLPDGGDEGGAGGDPCVARNLSNGDGSVQSPYTFRVLVYVEKETRTSAESQGWNVEAGVARHFAELNAAFNNGQLPYSYRFEQINLQSPALPPTGPFSLPDPELTPEKEDFLLLYDERPPDLGTLRDFYQSHVVRLGSPNLFDPAADSQRKIAHEFGHARGAIDLYELVLERKSNAVFPGSSYQWPGIATSLMGLSADIHWDPLTIELLRESMGDPRVDSQCAPVWLSRWSPSLVGLNVTNESGSPVAGASVDVYRTRLPASLWEGDLWHSGKTDSRGLLTLPAGITEASGGYSAILLGAVRFEGQSYLNWYTMIDLAIPYRQGLPEYYLPAKVGDATLYQPPPQITTGLSVETVAFSPSTVKVGEALTRQAAIKNLGPDAYMGEIGIQFYFSSNNMLETTDEAAGGYNESVNLGVGQTHNFQANPAVPPSTLPGAYYLIARITPLLSGATDPDESDNVRASDQALTILPP